MLNPIAVVEAQLEGLQRGEVQALFEFSSTRVRRATGPAARFEQIVRSAPALKPLIENDSFEILSALQIGPHAWHYRVRVNNTVGSIKYSVEYMMKVLQHNEGAIRYGLGQCFRHREHGFRGVIIGYDSRCEAPKDWQMANRIHELDKAGAQPFYTVLRDNAPAGVKSYVAQEFIEPMGALRIEHPDFDKYLGEKDIEGWVPKPILRDIYPKGLEGRWLVDELSPDRPANGVADEYRA